MNPEKDNNSKLIAGAAAGLALTLGEVMSGAASADAPLVSISSSSVDTDLRFRGLYQPKPAPSNSVADITNIHYSGLYQVPMAGEVSTRAPAR